MEPLIDNDDIQIQSQERLGWAAVAWSVVLLKGQKPGPAHGHGQGWKIVQGGDFKLAADSDIIKRGLVTKTGQTQSHCIVCKRFAMRRSL